MRKYWMDWLEGLDEELCEIRHQKPSPDWKTDNGSPLRT